MRILIEDDDLLRVGLTAGLRLQGFSEEPVELPEDALQVLGLDTFQALVLDFTLPDGSGLDLLAEVSAERAAAMKTPHPPSFHSLLP